MNQIDEVKAGDLNVVQNYIKKFRSNKKFNLKINKQQLTSLEGCPKEVTGDFNCSVNNLTSLKGCTEKVDGEFDCCYNDLISLEHCPQYINGNYLIHHNQLTSLEFAPKEINGDFICAANNLTSLDNCPIQRCVSKFICEDNQLTSLKGFPKESIENMHYINCAQNRLTSIDVNLSNAGSAVAVISSLNLPHCDFYCSKNKISSFENFPKRMIHCDIGYNKFTSFKDIDKHIEYIADHLSANNMNITSGFSDLFGIDMIQQIYIDNNEIQDIVNKYLPSKDLINFQDEMIKSGFESYL